MMRVCLHIFNYINNINNSNITNPNTTTTTNNDDIFMIYWYCCCCRWYAMLSLLAFGKTLEHFIRMPLHSKAFVNFVASPRDQPVNWTAVYSELLCATTFKKRSTQKLNPM